MCFRHTLPNCIFVILCLWGQVSVVGAENPVQTQSVPDSNASYEQKRHEQLDHVIQRKLAFYAKHYPNINFVLLDSAGDVSRNMGILAKVIGEDPDPLDYAHPKDLQYTLLMTTLMRIELLLNTDAGSATLFKPGKGALAQRKYVCVITMHPWQIAKDNHAATRHLLEIADSEFAKIPPSHYLDHIAHLQFALDHEVYHCLDTVFNGPVPMSSRKYWGDYYMLKEESAADAFGLIMHVAAHKSITPYAQSLRNIRGLVLLGGDLNHFSYQSLGVVLQQAPLILAGKDLQSRVQLASQISQQVVGSYKDYLRYVQAACFAMRQLGHECAVSQIRQGNVDHERIQALIEVEKECYQAIVGHKLPGLR
jgi:hypothetical protein